MRLKKSRFMALAAVDLITVTSVCWTGQSVQAITSEMMPGVATNVALARRFTNQVKRSGMDTCSVVTRGGRTASSGNVASDSAAVSSTYQRPYRFITVL